MRANSSKSSSRYEKGFSKGNENKEEEFSLLGSRL